eukprot:TRINITY_DN8089_c3_g2_i1.p1 TRINITY_DN8089_c3_g2~~TRINITY_DN8089_c3_g2_i1.p1  ORF type:complete len:372 (+),score=24.99 TRINITY_DN8089_c3_g2_i1:56-1171(+)
MFTASRKVLNSLTDVVCSKVMTRHKKVKKDAPFGLIEKVKTEIIRDIRKLIEQGGTPGTKTFQTSLWVMENGGLSVNSDIMKEYDKITPCDIAIYTKYLEICKNTRSGPTAVKTLKTMHGKGLILTSNTLITIFDSCRYSDILVKDILTHLDVTGNRHLLTSYVFVSVLIACKTFRYAFDLAQKNKSIIGTRSLLALMSRALSSTENTTQHAEGVEKLRADLNIHFEKDRNVKTSTRYFNTYITIYKNAGLYDTVFRVFSERAGCFNPDTVTYNLLLVSKVKLSDIHHDTYFREAEEFFAAIPKNLVTVPSFTAMMSLYAKYPKQCTRAAVSLLEKFKTTTGRDIPPSPLLREYEAAMGLKISALLSRPRR